MHRLFASCEELASESPSLDPHEIRHAKVLRLKDGEEVELFDGAGRSRRYSFAAQGCRFLPCGPLEETPRNRFPLVLFACVTKGERWDWTIQKAVELGADSIVPVISERTIVRISGADAEKKRERWVAIAREAARQSDAVWLAHIECPVPFAAALEMAAKTLCFAGAIADPPPENLLVAASSRLAGFEGGSVSVFIGPEGDFSPAELEALLRFAVPAGFGPRILRAETAAVYALSVLSALRETCR